MMTILPAVPHSCGDEPPSTPRVRGRSSGDERLRQLDDRQRELQKELEDGSRNPDAIKEEINNIIDERAKIIHEPETSPQTSALTVGGIADRYQAAMPGLAREVAERNAGRLKQAIENREYVSLLHPSNKTSRRIFEELIGKKLPRSIAGTIDIIKSLPAITEPVIGDKIEAKGDKGNARNDKLSTRTKDKSALGGVSANDVQGTVEVGGAGVSNRGAGRGSQHPKSKSGGAGSPIRGGRRDSSPTVAVPERGRHAKSGRNYGITESDSIGKGTLGSKAKDNVGAIELLKLIESEGRAATPCSPLLWG